MKYVKRLSKPLSTFGRILDNYLQFVRLRARGSNTLTLSLTINEYPYYAYILSRRKSKMKVVAHFKDDGPAIQKLIEMLLLECCISR